MLADVLSRIGVEYACLALIGRTGVGDGMEKSHTTADDGNE